MPNNSVELFLLRSGDMMLVLERFPDWFRPIWKFIPEAASRLAL